MPMLTWRMEHWMLTWTMQMMIFQKHRLMGISINGKTDLETEDLDSKDGWARYVLHCSGG